MVAGCRCSSPGSKARLSPPEVQSERDRASEKERERERQRERQSERERQREREREQQGGLIYSASRYNATFSEAVPGRAGPRRCLGGAGRGGATPRNNGSAGRSPQPSVLSPQHSPPTVPMHRNAPGSPHLTSPRLTRLHEFPRKSEKKGRKVR